MQYLGVKFVAKIYERSMNELEKMQWSVVRQEDASETEGKCLQNCGQTSSVVWGRDLGNNEGTRSTTRDQDYKRFRAWIGAQLTICAQK